MSNYSQSLIEDYKQTIERLQKECTEKTNAIIALGEQLKAKEQECKELKKQLKGDKGLITSAGKMNYQLLQEYDKLKNCLTEIKEFIQSDYCTEIASCEFCAETGNCLNRKILQKISEVENETK